MDQFQWTVHFAVRVPPRMCCSLRAGWLMHGAGHSSWVPISPALVTCLLCNRQDPRPGRDIDVTSFMSSHLSTSCPPSCLHLYVYNSHFLLSYALQPCLDSGYPQAKQLTKVLTSRIAVMVIFYVNSSSYNVNFLDTISHKHSHKNLYMDSAGVNTLYWVFSASLSWNTKS